MKNLEDNIILKFYENDKDRFFIGKQAISVSRAMNRWKENKEKALNYTAFLRILPVQYVLGHVGDKVSVQVSHEEKVSFVQMKMMEGICRSILDDDNFKFIEPFIKLKKYKECFSFLESSDEIKKMIKDNQDHLVMLCVFSQLNINEIKKILSPLSWKNLINNKFECNSKLYQAYLKVPSNFFKCINALYTLDDKNTVQLFLKRMKEQFHKDLLTEIQYIKIHNLNEESFNNLTNVTDAKRMALEQGRDFNIKWSPKRMKREHDDLSRQAKLFMYGIAPDTVFKLSETAENVLSNKIKNPKLKYKVLTKGINYVEESEKMHHCIASYAKEAVRGEYITIHINNDEYDATFGIRVVNSKTLMADQIKGISNNNDIPQEIEEMKNTILSVLNENLFKTLYTDQLKQKKKEEEGGLPDSYFDSMGVF